MTMNVSLGKKWETFVSDQLASGVYSNQSEVVRAGLRLLEQQDMERRALLKQISVSSEEELIAKIEEAYASPTISAEESKRRMKNYIKEQRAKLRA